MRKDDACREAIADLQPRILRDSRDSNVSLAWYRGYDAGIYDAYKKLRRKHPLGAQALLDAFGMNSKGEIGL